MESITIPDSVTSIGEYAFYDCGSLGHVSYNGKAQKPSVTVIDNQGKTVPGKNYTVQYANNKNVGQAAVTVTFKGSYSGTVTKTFDIVPKGTKISKIKAKKKGFTVKWKKQAVHRTYKTVNGKNTVPSGLRKKA